MQNASIKSFNGRLRDASARDRRVGNRGQAFAGDIVDDVEDAEPAPTAELIVNEIQRPAGVCPRCDQDRRTCARGPPPGAALLHRQALLAVEAIDPSEPRRATFPAQQDMKPPVAEPTALVRQLAQNRDDLLFLIVSPLVNGAEFKSKWSNSSRAGHKL